MKPKRKNPKKIKNKSTREEIIQKIMAKKELSELPLQDVLLAFKKFEKKPVSKEEKIRLTRDMLHRIFGAFGSRKLLKIRDKDPQWILSKHLSTRERLPFYREIYKRILKDFEGKIKIIDLGSGVNGFSYFYFKEAGFDVDYVAIEAIGQFVNLMNSYFNKEKINGKALHLSLFEHSKIKKIVKDTKNKIQTIIFLFKVVDSLEMLKRNYSKKLISELALASCRIVVSFATESMIKRRKFKSQRKWFVNFIKENFNIIDDFEILGEKFLVFEKRQNL